MDNIVGRHFIHSFWIKDLRGNEPVECVVTDKTDKEVVYASTTDKRVGRCKPKEFWRQFRQWQTSREDR